jgi:hypothetical protein
VRLHAAEHLSVAVIAILYAANLMIAHATDRVVLWNEWRGMYLIGLVIGLLGTVYRLTRRSEAVALSLLAITIMIFFTHAGGIFNHLLFPLQRPLIDSVLFAWDAWLGYDWVAFVEFVALWPALGRVLGHVYDSSLWQLLLVILVLGFSERAVQLHRFLLVGVLGGCTTILFWWLAPSFGPAAHLEVTDEVARSIRLRVDAQYGAALNRLAVEGLAVIRPESIMGVIAFPSFHTVMACMAVWFSWATRIFWPMALLNTAMIPAILSHGGHHLVDVFGGVAVFLAVWWLATLVVPTRVPTTGRSPLPGPVPAGLEGS